MEIIIRQTRIDGNLSALFDVETNDGRIADELCWEEMLGLVASLTVPDGKPCQQWLKPKKQTI